MPYSTCLQAVLTSCLVGQATQECRRLLDEDCRNILACVLRLLSEPVTAQSMAAFENDLAATTREMNRRIVEATCNQLEEAAADAAPKFVHYEASDYRRLNQATPNRHVASLFGTITLWRHGYRPRERDIGEPAIFPLEKALGLLEGVTPALAERVGLYLAEAGATQDNVLQRLRREHGVVMGVKRLRNLAGVLDELLRPQRHRLQVDRLLELLKQAHASTGRHKPVLSVGRDGVTLGQQPHGFFEVASTATVTVYDRRSQRLGTVYLGFVPEYGQGTLSQQLTLLIADVLRGWEGPLPRLCYVTDAGDNETSYYKRVLRRMKHPRTGVKLQWHWIVDYYHATERISVLAELLLGTGREAQAWAKKMRKLLLKPRGVARVLYSAAALRSTRGLAKKKEKAFARAYNYLRTRTRHMNYAEFKRLGLPLGSGVTEAACKTVFAQRLKLSGMRWKKEGAQVILNLRVLLLSGIWRDACQNMRAIQATDQPRTQPHMTSQPCQMAA